MKWNRALGLFALLALAGTPVAAADTPPAPIGSVRSDLFHTTFVRLGSVYINGLLYEPEKQGPNAGVVLVFSSPHALFNFAPAAEMASRGYRVLLVKHYLGSRRGYLDAAVDGIAETDRGIVYARSLQGVRKVVLMSHGDGARMIAFYANLSEHGPTACQSADVLYPCKDSEIPKLAKPDGVVMIEPTLGAFQTGSTVDPAYDGDTRSRTDLDMFAAANGYDASTGLARYAPEFVKRFHAAQSARNMAIVERAVARAALLDAGKAGFSDNEPLVIPGAVAGGTAASLYRTDLRLLAHTKRPHLLLKADGSTVQAIIASIRPSTGAKAASAVGTLSAGSLNYTVRDFLSSDAIRTTPEFAITADDILGVDWKSSNSSTPSNAEGVVVPALVVTMTCNVLVVPDEIVFDHLAATDKTYVAVEGAGHNFGPCKPNYGDTQRRLFDFVGSWLGKAGRF